jgi:zinc protease
MMTTEFTAAELEDLLGRPARARLGLAERQAFAGRRVLVTGAAGSIGSALARELAVCRPAGLVLLDQSELGLFGLERELRRERPQQAIDVVLADVSRRASMVRICRRFRPDVVYHAAAYKHVTMAERAASAAALVNVIGTPIQDGERSVTLHRTGDTPIVAALYRAPTGSHPDFPALEVLVELMRAAPQGRLHRALVQKGLASAIWGFERALHDPGYVAFGASLPKDGALDAAREALLATLDGVRREPVRAEELERARTTLLNEMDKARLDARELVSALAEFHTLGDWRLYYLYRDRLRAVTVADVQRVAEAYLLPDNRVLGQFVPTAQPQRAQIPDVPDVRAALEGYRGGAALAMGEAFDPTPQNIEARLQRRTLANGVRVALLPKRTRGATVVAKLDLHWGNEDSTRGRSTACTLAGEMLLRGSARHTRAELRDAFERMKATVRVSAGGATLETRREHLDEALRLVAEVLREPAFPAAEFDELKRSLLTSAEAQRSDPSAVASEALRRHLHPYPKGHWHYEQSLEERIAASSSAR